MKYVLVGLLCLSSFFSFSQGERCYASLDTSEVMIAQPFNLQVSLLIPPDSLVMYPEEGQSFLSQFECIRCADIDTLSETETELELLFSYTLSRFEPGSVSFRAGPYIIGNNDTLWSNPLTLMVHMPQVDTASAIMPIKAIKQPVYTWRDWLPDILLYAGIGLFVLILILLAIKYGKNLKKPRIVHSNIISETPYEKALRELDELDTKELWKDGKHKIHYTELTDILRTYVEEAFDIAVFEKTSDDFFHILTSSGKLSTSLFDDMRSLLTESDFVKFAKHKPEKDTVYKHTSIVRAIVQDLHTNTKTLQDNQDI
ncbi:MAG: hypothetical protein PF481_11705 [Bacteroidales bacterium]|jgi:hypothetical protein|nr:hypothetical protein [Bacteroidales bacterium]